MVTKKTFYAIKAMLFLARRQGRPAYSAEISSAENIPKHFLEQILTKLSHAGILYVIKGRNGGYSITLSPKEITTASILRIMQDEIISLPCIELNSNQKCDDCQHKLICGISEPFIQIRDTFFQKLAETNLESLMKVSEIPDEYQNTVCFDYGDTGFNVRGSTS